MADSPSQNDKNVMVLGPDVQLEGNLQFDAAMRLHGRLQGSVKTGGSFHVAREAHVQGEITAGTIIVEGDVRGGLTSEGRIELRETARYEGTLRAQKLVVAPGAVFEAQIDVGPNVLTDPSKKPK